MRGRLKLGGRWLPFRARQVLAPHRGFVWAARVGGLITGSDRYADGAGGMDWRLLGLVPLVHARGEDISRSAAARGAAESVWVPTTLLPRFGVAWSASAVNQVVSKRMGKEQQMHRSPGGAPLPLQIQTRGVNADLAG